MLIMPSKHFLLTRCQHSILGYLLLRRFTKHGHQELKKQNTSHLLLQLRRPVTKWMCIMRRQQTRQPILWLCVCCHISLYVCLLKVHAVLNPKEKMAHFKKHWSEDLQQEVLDCAEEVVCAHGVSSSKSVVLKIAVANGHVSFKSSTRR